MGKALGAGLQWMHDAGVLARAAARAGRDGRLLAGGGAPAQGRLGAHQAGGAAVGAEPDRALVGAAARHRQGADARHAARRARSRSTATPRSGARMWEPIAEAAAVRQARAPQDPLPDPEPPARQRVRAGLDRRRRAPVRSRDGRAPGRPAGAVARRRDVAPAGAARGGDAQHRGAARSASWRSATLDARVPPLPPGLGNAIMEAFAIPPSKRIGDLRKLCEDAIERGELRGAPRSRRTTSTYLRKSGAV